MRAIFEHDFLRFAMRPRYFVLRASIVALPVLFLMFLASTFVYSPPDVIGRWIFGSAMVSLLLLTIFVAPAMFAHTLAEERKNNKLDVLRTTPVSEAGIVLGKWTSRLGLMGSMCVAALPLAAFALLFGGVSPGQFLRGAAVVFATLFWVSAVTMVSSSMAANSGAAIRSAYALTLGYVIGLWLFGWLFPWWLLDRTSDLFGNIEHVLNSLHPFSMMTRVIFEAFIPPVTPYLDPMTIYVLGSLLLTLGCLARSIRNLKKDVAVRRERPIAVEAPIDGSGGEKLAGKFSRRLELLWRMPALWLELRRAGTSTTPLWRRLSVLTILIVGEGFFIVGLLERGRGGAFASNHPEVHLFPVLGSLFMAFLAAASHGASAFHRDHDANTLEVLHAAPLSDEVLARSKISGTLLLTMPWWLLSMAHIVLANVLGDLGKGVLLFYGAASAPLVAALAAFAMQVGLSAPTHAKASVRTFLTFLVYFALAPIFLGVLLMMGHGGGEETSFFLLLGYHPFVICALPILFDVDPDSMRTADGWMICLMYWLVYVILAAVLLRGSIPRLYAKRREQNWVVGPARTQVS